MIDLDIRTIQIISFATNVTLAWFIWMQRRPPVPTVALAARLWSLGFATIGLGALLTAMRETVPPTLSVMLGEAMAVSGYALAISGLRAFLNLRPALWMFPLSLVASAVISGYWSLIEPSASMRIAGLSVWGATQCIWMGYSLRFWRTSRSIGLRSRKPVAIIALLFGTFLIFYAIRMYIGDPLQTLPYQTDNGVVTTVACAALLSMFFALWCMSILSGHLGRSLRKEIMRRDRMLSVLAHDLRSPFNVLLGGTEAMAMLARSGKTERVLGLAQDVHESSKQAYALTDGLLNWAKSQFSGAPDMPVDLDKATSAAAASLRERLLSKRIELIRESTDSLEVTGHPGGVETIIRNLLSNAIKFSRPDSSIHIHVHVLDENAVLTVEDHGVGIAPSALRFILDPEHFHSTLGTEGESGTGLGLSFCRDIAEASGGRLNIDSAQGKGTKVSVQLPLHRP